MNQMVFREDSGLVAQVLWARLRALMNEAGATLKRTAFSFPTRESNDFATVLMDTEGSSIAQSIQVFRPSSPPCRSRRSRCSSAVRRASGARAT